MLAGHETTANAMSWFWYLMARHAEARDRMLAEIDDVLGSRRPGAADLGRLPWTTVIIPIHHIHHDPRWWPDPETFDPNRFGASHDRPRCAYLPFGGGRRICIGQSFALMEMVLIAAIMSQRFTLDLAPGHPVELEATLTLRPKHGVQVIASDRR